MRTEYKTANVIHVKHMLHTAMRQWKVLLVLVAVFAIFSGVLGYIQKQKEAEKIAALPDVEQKEITVTTEGFYRVKAVTEFEETLKSQKDYNENSALMKIDPLHKWGCIIQYVFSGTEEEEDVGNLIDAYYAQMSHQQAFLEINDGLSEPINEGYLRELITFETPGEDMIVVKIMCFSEERIEEITSAFCGYVDGLLGEMRQRYGSFEIEPHVGQITESVDIQLSERQNTNRMLLINAQDGLMLRQEALEGNEPAYLKLYREARLQDDYEDGQPLIQEAPVKKKEIKVSLWTLKKQIVLGGIAGFAIGIILLCLKYVYSTRILNVQNIEEMYGIPVLCYVNKKVDAKVCFEMTAVKLALKNKETGSGRKLALTGTVSGEKYSEFFQTFAAALKKQDIVAETLGSIAAAPEEYKKLKDKDAVILVEKVGESRFADLGRVISLCEEVGKPVEGVIVVE